MGLYLTKDANISTLKQIATLAPGSILAMTFYIPIELIDEEDKPLQQMFE
jgi:O-methyltransferase involved in polyketide biosynthesis